MSSSYPLIVLDGVHVRDRIGEVEELSISMGPSRKVMDRIESPVGRRAGSPRDYNLLS